MTSQPCNTHPKPPAREGCPGKAFQAVLVILFWLAAVSGQGQDGNRPMPNLVPNPGFEAYSAPPLGWFLKGEHFTEVMKYWSSPTGASPDAFGPRVRVPAQWAEKGFGRTRPHQGESMAGITLFGCEEGKPHCREYLQIQLIEPLIIGQEYYVEFWVSPLPQSLRVNHIDVHFALQEIRLRSDVRLDLAPQICTREVMAPDEQDNWTRITSRFTARREANYLVIGNFFPDSLTNTLAPCDPCLPFAYYYIDDVLVRKEEPILPVPVPPDDLSKVEIREGVTIRLRQIFFETDRAELLPRSFSELNKLLQLMRRNSGMIIQINGHTDVRGDDAYNQDLSERRARAVVEFLVENGIAQARIRSVGYGSTLPIGPNDTDDGRQLNRRVEFVVLKM